MTSNIPKLCGGTFLTLLLQAVKPHNRSHVTINGEKVSLSNGNVFRSLIRVFDPTSYLPDDKSFNTMTSKYKNCNKIGDVYFRYDDPAIISSFNQEILTNYLAPLNRMREFVETYIDIETPAKSSWLVRAILELLMEDSSVLDDAAFHIGENGSALIKSQLGTITDVSIESFLLGIWHFLIMNRNDNTIGKATIDSWHTLQGEPNAQKEFISEIGKTFRPELKVSRLINSSYSQKIQDEPEVEIVEPEILDNEKSGKTESNEETRANNTYNQTMNVFNQFGSGSTMVNNFGTFINRKSRGVDER